MFAKFNLLYGILVIAVLSQAGVAASGIEYLSDLQDRILYVRQSFGKLGIDTCAYAEGAEPLEMQIKDRKYTKGLGHHAKGEIVVALDGEYKTFESDVGVQWQNGSTGSVVFQVYVDSEKVFDSGIIREKDPPKKVRLAVEGAYELRLVSGDGGDGITCDCANWADARLIRNPSAATGPASRIINVAPFARIMTWNPDRMQGTKAKRTEEFPAEDLFLGKEIIAADDGIIAVPVTAKCQSCIGLQWYETRLINKLSLQFADSLQMPAVEGVEVQWWKGMASGRRYLTESDWQGAWEPYQAEIKKDGNRLTAKINYGDYPKNVMGTRKIRWVFPAGKGPVVLKSLSAHTPTMLGVADLGIELEKPLAGKTGRVEIYNGVIVSAADGGSLLDCSWDLSETLKLKVRYSKQRPWKTDRTVVRFQLPEAAFGVAVDDVLANECVYVRHAGVFVTKASSGITLADYRRKIAGRKTVLEQVREGPDQTFEQAWEKVHNPIQDKGPMMLSLACDNRKYVAYREGAINFDIYDGCDHESKHVARRYMPPYKLVGQFGEGKPEHVSRHLYGGWLPVPVTARNEKGVVYQQRTFVAPVDDTPVPDSAGMLYERALCVSEYTIKNNLLDDAGVSLAFKIVLDAKKNLLAGLQLVDKGVIATKEGRLLMFADTSGAAPLEVRIQSDIVRVTGALEPQKSARFYVYLPAWKLGRNDYGQLVGGLKWLENTAEYWKRVMAPAMQVELPDGFLTNVIRASQVHCLLAARNEERAKRVSAWIASDRYGPLESESQVVVRGMDMMGHRDFARRSLDFFIDRYNPAGYLTTGYTIMGTGQHLWVLAEHYGRMGDKAWFGRVAPKVANVVQWLARQCEKTKRLDVRGNKVPEYGLAPPGVAADWGRYAYRFYQEAHYYAGLQQAAQALADINYPDAPMLLEKADEFRSNIQRAFHWSQMRSPVFRLADGTWVPSYPSMVYCLGRTGDIIPGEDANRSWAYDLDLGSHYLAATGALAPNAQEVTWLTEHMEDVGFLLSGMGDYPAEKSRKDFFNLGGFAKVQPYYCRIAEVYALRDDVKPFIRSYFNTIPSLLSRENLSFWEHFHNIGAWNKTHETGHFLAQSRIMLVMERGDELWLAPFVTNNWLKDGMEIKVSNAPTCFGPVSYQIDSSVADGYIEATIEPPNRSRPEALVLRIRHPEGKPMRSVQVNGANHRDFDVDKEVVRIDTIEQTIEVRISY
ncbi:MAG: NPCBM/NEW2 domain-containing protein [Planctomycetota bacterium]|jgi:hypothetical protein